MLQSPPGGISTCGARTKKGTGFSIPLLPGLKTLPSFISWAAGTRISTNTVQG